MEMVFLLAVVLVLAIHYPKNQGPTEVKRDWGKRPFVDVTFNNSEEHTMLLDTGASKTTITQEMAKSLNAKPIGTGTFILANGQQEKMTIARVDSIEIGGIKVNDVEVAVAPAGKQYGLLGQNVYGDREVRIKRDVVEFNEE